MLNILLIAVGLVFQWLVMQRVQEKEEVYRYPKWMGYGGMGLYVVISYFLIGRYGGHLKILSVLLLLVAVYLVVAWIDFSCFLIPNRLSLLSFLLAVAFLILNWSHASVFLVGSVSFLGVFVVLFIISMNSFGMGDVKLSVSMGMILGAGLLLKFLMWTFLLGTVVSLILLLLKIKKKDDKIAFGPYMVFAFVLLLLI